MIKTIWKQISYLFLLSIAKISFATIVLVRMVVFSLYSEEGLSWNQPEDRQHVGSMIFIYDVSKLMIIEFLIIELPGCRSYSIIISRVAWFSLKSRISHALIEYFITYHWEKEFSVEKRKYKYKSVNVKVIKFYPK